MNISVRVENQNDYNEVENITREAFWDVYKPGCDEHLILHKLRQSSEFIKELSFVAVDGNNILGHIIYSKAKVINNNIEHEVLCMGPISVVPNYQCKGIGSLLLNHSINAAKMLNYSCIVTFGNPKYYHNFGFENAQKYGITTSNGMNFEEFMVLCLNQDSLEKISGKFHESSSFKILEEELTIFEKNFPFKEKHITDTQLK
ncbi:GCN5-related N-acetyltransferase [Methanococcus vannielii SB]|uniref:GCN5-related N-acetyltransferase n=1 Tax=Methanococcus vannielii (strain ATCC 35089 / DSM 1224 / JCM 13029 / OCM 148 / SB) TaxID=406327 RepID=A6USC5_METVS|nr:N-acetyltransferase [Methanococcus vannielii]ABR55397.1 GCN5-related N-acetyltransferase [Methanococcus vannielii SB]